MAKNPGVIDENINSLKGMERLGNHCTNGIAIGNIGADWERTYAKCASLLCNSFSSFQILFSDCNICTLFGKLEANRPPNPLSAARNDCHAIL